MAKPWPQVKLLLRHKTDCLAMRDWPENPWSFLDVIWLNWKGNPTRHSRRPWLHFRCNDIQCPATAAMREDYMEVLLQRQLQTGISK